MSWEILAALDMAKFWELRHILCLLSGYSSAPPSGVPEDPLGLPRQPRVRVDVLQLLLPNVHFVPRHRPKVELPPVTPRAVLRLRPHHRVAHWRLWLPCPELGHVDLVPHNTVVERQSRLATNHVYIFPQAA